ncbi:HNH homing endonuclease [Acinetobacter phage IME-200]|uniref:HNH homing endonuclease n=2 Tax=Friunavirus TaxID=1985711 RepID=A0A0P0ICV0_9CAUD|nr:endonuclease [Acinetobacter phage IME-200]ALJ97665.1 HNH homing endonuclease [Acinetobacter phage IME-200]QFG06938.1 HNH homing endonuclease [Acinetobacter phage vB_AbaP_APK48]QGK90423.1 HNH homing endonuclease [Acinetobacter phage vB_AbaP_APK44]
MSDCILWNKSTDKDGYGQIVLKGKRYLAHRLAYVRANNLEYSDISGKLVRHKCDNPTCINPEHLELGTHQDNMDDRNKRNRTAKGEDHGNAKLTPQQVKEIRASYIKGSKEYGSPALARKYNVSFQQIHKIVTNQRYSGV